MKIGVIGSRTFDDYELVKTTLNAFKSITEIISGGAKGADALGERYADENLIKAIILYPDWNEHGKAAGPIRNTMIVEESDLVIAFWDKKSKGTRDSISKCYKQNVPVLIVFYKNLVVSD